MNGHQEEISNRLADVLNRAVGLETPAPVASRAGVYCAQMDVKETETEFSVYADLPGVDEDDIDIRIEGQVLEFGTEREFDHDQEDAEEYVQIGRSFGYFCGRVELPTDVDPASMTAKYRRGVLRIRLLKSRNRVRKTPVEL